MAQLKSLEIDKQVWGEKGNPFLVHQVVVKELSSRRQGNSKVKSRHEVAGSTRKIYRQKGTGNARHGDIKAPLFVGGGQAFGPKPRDWSYVLPRKIRKGGLRAVILQRKLEEKLWLLENLDWQTPKTKLAAQFFAGAKITSGLVVVEGTDQMAERAIRNLARFAVRRWEDVSVADILKYENLILTQGAYQQLTRRLVQGEKERVA